MSGCGSPRGRSRCLNVTHYEHLQKPTVLNACHRLSTSGKLKTQIVKENTFHCLSSTTQKLRTVKSLDLLRDVVINYSPSKKYRTEDRVLTYLASIN